MTLPTDIIAGEPVFLGITTVLNGGGSGDDKFYVHEQTTPLATWTISHSFGRYPAVTVIDSSGFVIITDVEYSNSTTVVLTFAQPKSGKALLV